MARFDKYDPKDGGFRAPLGFAIQQSDVGTPVGVGLNSSGILVRGGGNTTVVGVICPSELMAVGEIIDVMTDGEIVYGSSETGLVAGTRYYAAAADGVLSTTNTGVNVGFTVQAWRLVVRSAR